MGFIRLFFKYSIAFGVLSLQLSCVTSPSKTFSDIKVGTHKDVVLDTMGSPYRTEFKNGRYIWIYKITENDRLTTKEVDVKDDQVVYVGEVLPDKAQAANKVHRGMAKGEVIDLLGLPSKTRKENSREIWLYVFSNSDSSFSQEIQFENDHVVTTGSVNPASADQTQKDGDPVFTPVN